MNRILLERAVSAESGLRLSSLKCTSESPTELLSEKYVGAVTAVNGERYFLIGDIKQSGTTRKRLCVIDIITQRRFF